MFPYSAFLSQIFIPIFTSLTIISFAHSRPLREKTTIAVTSKGRYGLEEERGATRRRSMPRSLGGMSTGVTESIMIQALRQEEQQRAREEKR